MKDHAQKCVKRQCEFAHKTVDQLHPLSRRSSNKTRRLAISWRSEQIIMDTELFCTIRHKNVVGHVTNYYRD